MTLPIAVYGVTKYGESIYSDISSPTVSLVSAGQRDRLTFLVDLRFVVLLPTGPVDAGLVTFQYSLDDGATWNDATVQPYDRRHSPGLSGVISGISSSAQEHGVVWDAFIDLPEGDFSVKLFLELSITGGNPNTSLTTEEFQITTIIPPLDEDRLASGLDRRRLAERIDDFLGAGPIAPLRRGGSDFMTGRGRELVKSAIWQILNTRAATDRWGGEIPWDPAFGSLFWTLKHAPGDEITEELAHSYAEDALGWEPRVLIENVETEFFSQPRGGRGLRVKVGYSIIAENVPSNEVILPEVETVEVEVA